MMVINRKLIEARVKLNKAQEEYKELAEKEKARFGRIAEDLNLIELSETDIIVAFSSFAYATVNEQLAMYKAVRNKLPARFHKKIDKAVEDLNSATQTPTSSINPVGETSEASSD